MKKMICILLSMIFLIGCSGADQGAWADVPTVFYQDPTDMKMGCLIEVPQIMDSENEDALAINAELRELSQTMQDTYWFDEVMWCEMTAWPTETERYISITLLIREYPSYGTEGQIMSWVYDKDKGSRVTLDDALAIAKTDMDTIKAGIASWCENNDYVMTGEALDFLAFRMTEDNAPQFMTSAAVLGKDLVGEIDPWSSLFTWKDGTVEWPCSAPFDPAEVTGTFTNFLFCQTYENMGQYEGDALVMSEAEAMVLFEEIYEINKYLEDGYTMRFDGSTVEINGETCIVAVMENEDGAAEAHYAAVWGSAYILDPVTGEWTAVGFG